MWSWTTARRSSGRPTVHAETGDPASRPDAGFTERVCQNFDTSSSRRLSVCVQAWASDTGADQSRGVVTMHSYVLVNGHPVDSVSRSITINRGFFSPGSAALVSFGQDIGPSTCRVGSPSSSQISCSVPNTAHGLLQHGLPRPRLVVRRLGHQGLLPGRHRRRPCLGCQPLLPVAARSRVPVHDRDPAGGHPVRTSNGRP
jgi:hypothetical protein